MQCGKCNGITDIRSDIGVIGCFAWSEENAEELASEYDNYVRILQYYKKTRLGE